MNAIQRHMGLALSGVVAATCIWACTATREPDGSLTVEFAPDKAINTKGLEDALRKLNDLMEGCLSATPRPCTDSEIDDIVDAMERVLRRKMKTLDSPQGPGGVG